MKALRAKFMKAGLCFAKLWECARVLASLFGHSQEDCAMSVGVCSSGKEAARLR